MINLKDIQVGSHIGVASAWMDSYLPKIWTIEKVVKIGKTTFTLESGLRFSKKTGIEYGYANIYGRGHWLVSVFDVQKHNEVAEDVLARNEKMELLSNRKIWEQLSNDDLEKVFSMVKEKVDLFGKINYN